MTSDDRKDDATNDVLGIARGPVPQTDEERAIGRAPGSQEGSGTLDDGIDTSLVKEDTGYGVPKAPPGLHVED